MKFTNWQTDLMGVFHSCPLGVPMDNCPFQEIHKMPVTQKAEILFSLSPEAVEELYNYHCACVYYRESRNLTAIRELKSPFS